MNYVHRSILSRVSKFMHDILSSPCECQGKDILILPSSLPSTLASIVSLIYTGVISDITRAQSDQVSKLANLLGLKVTNDNIDGDDNDIFESNCSDKDDQSDQALMETDGNDYARNSQLKITTRIIDKKKKMNIDFSLPKCRLNRPLNNLEIEEKLTGFQGRIQVQYNRHPVGQYMGPFDQNKNIKLNAQLPDSELDYTGYTEFQHSGDACYKLSLNSYNKYDVLDKVDSYRIDTEIIDSDESDSNSEVNDEDQKSYTCQYQKCQIPCPCPQCSIDLQQCKDHKIKHSSFFCEKKDTVSIRSSKKFCKNKNFFSKSYIIKYAGIPQNCKRCGLDLLNHHAYHLDYHEKCRYCKQAWYKYKAKTEKELKSLEKDEVDYFKSVCPFCDKQFMRENEARRHIRSVHSGLPPFKCDYCEKRFNSGAAKVYHERCTHAGPVQSISCDVCKKKFSSTVTLKAHNKYVHLNLKSETCKHCDKRFNQKKNLRVHLANVHGINQMKEKYCESDEEEMFRCDRCDVEFAYKKNFDAHKREKHAGLALYQCKQCKSKFKQKRNLAAHEKSKHGSEEFPCSKCGKVFAAKRYLMEHMKTHND